MSPKLNSSITIHKLASDLGLRPTENPVQVILAYCHRSVKKFLAEHGHCASLGELLNLLASKLGTRILEINDSDRLRKIQREYVNRGEKIFATLEQELSDDDCYGITFRLQNPELWELHHVSIIDCRGEKRYRRYHTKWHEIGHLLILTDQTRLAFRRTHDAYHPKSAEESLVDAIAGEFSFYRSIITPAVTGQISFEKIEQIRATYCPEASVYSAMLNVSKLWPTPCIWIEARLAGRKSEENSLQHSFGFNGHSQKSLRAVHTSANDAARAVGFGIIQNFRVPKKSVIYRVFEQDLPSSQAIEDLSWWECSDGTRLSDCKVRVQAKRIGESIHALIVPV